MKNKKFSSTLEPEVAVQSIASGLAEGSYVIGSISSGTISAAFIEDRRATRSSSMLAFGPLGLLAKAEKSHPVTVVVSPNGAGSRVVVASDHDGAFHDVSKALKTGERGVAKQQKAQAGPKSGGFVDRMNAMVEKAKAMDAAAKRQQAGASVPATPTIPSGWHPDPTGRHETRFWDGGTWTEHVTDAGVPAVDPLS